MADNNEKSNMTIDVEPAKSEESFVSSEPETAQAALESDVPSVSDEQRKQIIKLNGAKAKKREYKQQSVLMFIALAYVIYGIIFNYIPLLGWLMGFENYKAKDGIFHSTFVGLDKFKFLFKDKVFLEVIRNTFAMGFLNLVFSFIFAIAFAILLNEIRTNYLKKPIQTISYLPHFLSWIIVTGILHDALSLNGVVNELFMNLHIFKNPVNFFSIPALFWPIVTFANIWKETGWNAIIYLAAITAIDPSYYEAAAIDGAGRWAKIKYITLPSIKPTVIILLLLNIGNILNAGFEVQYLLENGLIQRVSRTIDVYVLKWGIGQNDYSLGTAAGIFKSVVSIVLILIFNKIAKNNNEERLF